MGKYGTSTQIANSETCKCGSMICKSCQQEIKGDYLIVEHYESKRGNEDDYNELFCYECSKGRKVWIDHFKKVENERKTSDKEHIKDIEKAVEMIKKSSQIEFDSDEEECVIIKIKKN